MIKKHKKSFIFISLIILFFVGFIAFNLGSQNHLAFDLKWDLRLPRILGAIIGGGALAVAGHLLQITFKNPLIDPSLIGISSAAQLAALLWGLFFPNLVIMTPTIALIAGIIIYFIILALNKECQFNPLRLVLIGIALNTICNALLMLFKLLTGNNLMQSMSISTLASLNFDDILLLSIYVIASLICLCFLIKKINLLVLSDQKLTSLGIDVKLLKMVVALIAIVLSCVCSSLIGIISFIALIVPHITKVLIGEDNHYVIPLSLILGGMILLIADTLSRTLFAPLEVDPNILLSLIGAFIFIGLLKGNREYGN